MLQPVTERRAQPRSHLHLWAVVRRRGTVVREKIIIANLSRAGFKMRSASAFAAGDSFCLELAIGLLAEARVTRSSDTASEYGCKFLYPLNPSIVQNILVRERALNSKASDRDVALAAVG